MSEEVKATQQVGVTEDQPVLALMEASSVLSVPQLPFSPPLAARRLFLLT